MNDTIFALSSGGPPAAIAVVRISGRGADAALAALTDGPLPDLRQASLRDLARPDDGALLDRALVLRFAAPATATGEDVVELHLHGGRATIAAVLDALAEMPGLRPAAPGEFTRRAFRNGRIDLSEAEGLADLLRAETESQRRAALGRASGGLARRVEAWRVALLSASARVEAAIDFADEGDVEDWPREERSATLGALASEMAALLASPPAERLRDGVRVGIAGPPNAGKSTLINALAARDVALTSPIAGTTRDVIEAPVRLGGVPLVLVDMAGLRERTGDAIEAAGIARAHREVAGCDIVVWLGPCDAAPQHSLVVTAKADLLPPGAPGDLKVSAMTGAGLAALTGLILDRARALLPPPDALTVNHRQRGLLVAAKVETEAAAAHGDLLVVAEHLRLARLALDGVSGRVGVEDMLDALFAGFCIGK